MYKKSCRWRAIDSGLVCWNEDNNFQCNEYIVRFCCDNAVTITSLDAGTCPGTGASWSEWRSEDAASGHCDFDGMGRHVAYRQSHFWNWPPIPRLICNTLYAVQGRVTSTGLMETDQVVRFGLNVYMDLPTTLNLNNVGSGWSNPRLVF